MASNAYLMDQHYNDIIWMLITVNQSGQKHQAKAAKKTTAVVYIHRISPPPEKPQNPTKHHGNLIFGQMFYHLRQFSISPTLFPQHDGQSINLMKISSPQPVNKSNLSLDYTWRKS